MLNYLKSILFLLLTLFAFHPVVVFAQFTNEEELRKQADKYFEDDEYDKCYKLYSQLVSHYLKDPNLNYKLGVCMLFVEPDKKKCFPFLEFANKNFKDCEKEAKFFLGKAYHLNFKFDEAMKYYAQYKEVASGPKVKKLKVDQEIQACKNGKRLLSNLTELVVSEKKQLARENYFRSYNLADIGGKLLVKPSDFISSIDKKKKDQSIIYLPKSNNQLYYASYGETENTGKDIYIVTRLENGEWSKPKNAGTAINTEYDEDYPFLHPNGKVLYFASKGHNSMGGYDVFKSELDEATGTWKAPVNMDFPINTPDDDILFVTDSLEKTAYFSSSRNSPFGKIDVYKINTERRVMDFAFVSGKVLKKEANQSVLSKIHVKNIDNGEEIGNFNANDSGHYSMKLPNGGKLFYTVETPGFTTQSETVKLPQATNLKPYRQVIFYENQKLVVQNFFDEVTNAEDAYLQYLDLIEQQSKLDVNINKFPEETASASNTKPNKEPTDTKTANQTASPLSVVNKEQVDINYENAKNLNIEADQLNVALNDAQQIANTKNTEAEEKNITAAQALDKARMETDAGNKEKLTEEASLLKENADIAKATANVTASIVKQLQEDITNTKKEAELTLNYAQQLETLVKNPENKELQNKLESTKNELETLKANTKSKKASTIVNDLITNATKKQEELKKAIIEAENVKKDEERMKAELVSLDKQIAETKDKDLIENYKTQQEEIKTELKNSITEIAKSEAKVKNLQKENIQLNNQIEIANKITAKIPTPASIAATTAPDNKSLKDKNTLKNESENTNDLASSSTKQNNKETLNNADNKSNVDNNTGNNTNQNNGIATNTNPANNNNVDNNSDNNTPQNNGLATNTNPANNNNGDNTDKNNSVAANNNSATNNNVANNTNNNTNQNNGVATNSLPSDKNKIKDNPNSSLSAQNQTNTDNTTSNASATNLDYKASSEIYETELKKLNNLAVSPENNQKKTEVLNNYIQSIDKEINKQQIALNEAKSFPQKAAINNNIQSLQIEKSQKSKILNEINTESTNTTPDVVSNANNPNKDGTSENTLPANYPDAVKQYDEKLGQINQTPLSIESAEQKNMVLKQYIQSINKELKQEKVKFDTIVSVEEKNKLAQNIKELESKKTEKANELLSNSAKLETLKSKALASSTPLPNNTNANNTKQKEEAGNTQSNVVANNIKTEKNTINPEVNNNNSLTESASNTQNANPLYNTPVPSNYQDASNLFDKQLNTINSEPITTKNIQQKNRVLKNYLNSIDSEIAQQQSKLEKTDVPEEKNKLTASIQNLQLKKTEKSAELETSINKLSSMAADVASNSPKNNLDDTATTANTGNETNTKNYKEKTDEYELQLASIKNAPENLNTVQQKNTVLSNYIKTIDKEIKNEQVLLDKAASTEEKEKIAANIQKLETKKTEKSTELASNTTQLASLSKTETNITNTSPIVENNTKEQTPVNYKTAEQQYEQQLSSVNNAPETNKTILEKTKILSNYIQSIDKEINNEQEQLGQTTVPAEKEKISSNIKTLREKRNEKSNELVASSTKLAANTGPVENSSTNTNNNVEPINYAAASTQFEEKMLELNKAPETDEKIQQKNKALTTYLNTINGTIIEEQQKLEKTNSAEEKLLLATNIQKLQDKKNETTTLLETNTGKLVIINENEKPGVKPEKKVYPPLPDNYTGATAQLTEQISELDTAAVNVNNLNEKNELLSSYLSVIDKEINEQQVLLGKTRKKKKKAVIVENIKNLEANKTEKNEAIANNNRQIDSLDVIVKNEQRIKDSIATNNPGAYDDALIAELNGLKEAGVLSFKPGEKEIFSGVTYINTQAKELKNKADVQHKALIVMEEKITLKINVLEQLAKSTPTALISEQEIKDIQAKADKFSDEAVEIRRNAIALTGAEKDEAIEKIAAKEKQADEIRLLAAKKLLALHQQQYQNNANNLSAISTNLPAKSKQDDIKKAGIVVQESKTLYGQSLKIQEEGKKETAPSSKLAIVTLADEKLLAANSKQTQAIALFQKFNPDYQIINKTGADLALLNKAQAKEIQQLIAYGTQDKLNTLKTISEANLLEYTSQLDKLKQLEKENPSPNPEVEEAKGKALNHKTDADNWLTKVNATNNIADQNIAYIEANKSLSSAISQLNQALKLIVPATLAANTPTTDKVEPTKKENNNEAIDKNNSNKEVKDIGKKDTLIAKTNGNQSLLPTAPKISTEQLTKLKKSPEQYTAYLNLTKKADTLNTIAEKENGKAQVFYEVATKYLKESNDLRINADSLPEGSKKDSLRNRAIELDHLANSNKSSGDSIREVAQNARTLANSKITEANNLINLQPDKTIAALKEPGTAGNILEGNGFNVGNKSPYSDANPIPIDEKLPDGLIFRVQIGAFRKLLPNDAFGGLSPVGGERATNGFIRYQVGLFNEFNKANAVKNDLRNLAYKDAFVVAYFNGKRININDAMNQLKNQGIAVNVDNNSSAGIKNTSNVTNGATLGLAPTLESSPVQSNDLGASQGLLFTVQIGVYNSQVKSNQTKNLNPIFREKLPTGLYRYTAGIYNNLDRVKKDRSKVNTLGISDAFVSAYFNGQRIKITDAISKLNGEAGIKLAQEQPIVFGTAASIEPTVPQTTPQNTVVNLADFSNGVKNSPAPSPENGVKQGDEGISYKVQIGAYKTQIPPDVAGNFMKIKSWPVKNTKLNDLYIYTIGSFIELKYAKKLQQEALGLGIVDAFIVVYKDGKKLFGEEAVKYLKQ